MRLLASILAVLILVLSCLPCADMHDVSMLDHNLGLNYTESAKPNSDLHQDKQERDLCSPFCHCSCCTVYYVINLPITVPRVSVQKVLQTYTSHITAEVFEISLPVWQPPQLV